jgi:Cys-tRNA(Pro)/Cys-tRNA(Cys) deacylase
MQLPAHQFLDDHRIPYQKLTFPPTTEKGAASVAHVLGYRESQMVKTLIFEAGTGEKVLVMLAADKNAVSGHLKKAVGSRNIKLAGPDTVRETTGYDIGSIPPFHWQPPGFRSFIDTSLMHEEVLGVGAGVWGQEIIMTPEHVVQATQAAVVNLTDKSTPVLPLPD